MKSSHKSEDDWRRNLEMAIYKTEVVLVRKGRAFRKPRLVTGVVKATDLRRSEIDKNLIVYYSLILSKKSLGYTSKYAHTVEISLVS